MRRKARTVPVIVQDEEPVGNPGSVRTHGGFLPAQLDFAALLTFLPERGWPLPLVPDLGFCPGIGFVRQHGIEAIGR